MFADSELEARKAMQELRDERDGTASGIICRYPSINRTVRKMFRPYHIYGLAGHTGSGKSYLFERLNLDFSNIPIVVDKKDFSHACIERLITVCHFVEVESQVVLFPLNESPIATYTCNLEIATSRQMQRRLGDIVKMSLAKMSSSELDPMSSITGIDTYRKATDEDLKLFEVILMQLPQPQNQFFIDKSEHLNQIIDFVYDHYENLPGSPIPILAIDHLLLLQATGDDFRLMNDSIRQLIGLAKLGFIIFPIAQFNNNYSDANRWKNPENHYPSDNDLYMGGQFMQGVDEMFALIQPKKFGCKEYGPRKINTKNLLHLANLKNREGDLGNLWFMNDLKNGEIPPATVNDLGIVTKTLDLYEQRKIEHGLS